MPLAATGRAIAADVVHSPAMRGAVTAGIILVIIGFALCACVLTTFLLRRYFRRRPWIDHAHRAGVYLLTMLGVLVLLIAAILGALLPVVPGVLFLLGALLLLRRYYRSKWMEARIRYLRFRLLVRRAIKRRLHRKHRISDNAKNLRRAPRRPRRKTR